MDRRRWFYGLGKDGLSTLAQNAVTTQYVPLEFPALDRIENPLTETLRIGLHDSPPHKNLPSNGVPSNC